MMNRDINENGVGGGGVGGGAYSSYDTALVAKSNKRQQASHSFSTPTPAAADLTPTANNNNTTTIIKQSPIQTNIRAKSAIGSTRQKHTYGNNWFASPQ